MKHYFLECGGQWPMGISHGEEEDHFTTSGEDIGTIKEILVIFFCGIGDMIVFIPALEALSSFFCKSRISVMTSPPAHRLLDNHPRVESIFLIDAARQKGFFQRFDLIINLSGRDAEINRIIRAAKVKHVIIKERLFDKKYPLHATEYHLEYFKGIMAAFYKPLVYIADEERQAARKYLFDKKIDPEIDLIIAIHAGSSNPGKLWDWRRFRKVCNLLMRDYGAKILLLSGPSEREITEKIAGSIDESVMVQEPIRLVTALLEQCTLLITNDSGIMHLAAAVGTPLVSIFGASFSRPEIWGPLTDNHVVICKETHEAISVEDVMGGVGVLLGRIRRQGAAY
jgi:lipopolysaccharide heptosyltransferase II